MSYIFILRRFGSRIDGHRLAGYFPRPFTYARRGCAMSRGIAVVGLLLGLVSGCAGVAGNRAESGLRSGYQLPEGYVQMDVALLERPLGDRYLNQTLWTCTDETVVGLDARPRLDENGLRVGQIVGMPPGGLQGLLTSPRTCLNPRRWILPTAAVAGSTEPPRLLLGPIEPETRFVVKRCGASTEVAFDNVQYQLEVEPGLTSDGRLQLAFTPRVEYGEITRTVVVPPDRTDFVVQVEKPSKTFKEMRFTVTLAPNEYLVIGGSDAQPGSLGYQAFTSESVRQPVQRLLVIRATRATAGSETDAPTLEDMARAATSPPLALQASRSAVRCCSRTWPCASPP